MRSSNEYAERNWSAGDATPFSMLVKTVAGDPGLVRYGRVCLSPGKRQPMTGLGMNLSMAPISLINCQKLLYQFRYMW